DRLRQLSSRSIRPIPRSSLPIEQEQRPSCSERCPLLPRLVLLLLLLLVGPPARPPRRLSSPEASFGCVRGCTLCQPNRRGREPESRGPGSTAGRAYRGGTREY